jgi:hypothetical protein
MVYEWEHWQVVKSLKSLGLDLLQFAHLWRPDWCLTFPDVSTRQLWLMQWYLLHTQNLDYFKLHKLQHDFLSNKWQGKALKRTVVVSLSDKKVILLPFSCSIFMSQFQLLHEPHMLINSTTFTFVRHWLTQFHHEMTTNISSFLSLAPLSHNPLETLCTDVIIISLYLFPFFKSSLRQHCV